MLLQRLFAAIAATLLSLHAYSAEPGPILSAPEAYAWVEAGNMTLIDIRRPEEWRQTGVAKNARRINMEHPQGLVAFLRQVTVEVGGDGNAPIGLICRTGNRTTLYPAGDAGSRLHQCPQHQGRHGGQHRRARLDCTRLAGGTLPELLGASLKVQAAQQPSALPPGLPLAWIGGHGTVPYEQYTQQSPGRGISTSWHPSHS